MKSDRRQGWDICLLWAACVVALGIGCDVAFGSLGGAIDEQHALTIGIASIARANAHVLEERHQTARDERDLTADVQRFALSADRAATVARFIRLASSVADHNHIAMVALEQSATGLPAFASPRDNHTAITDAIEFDPISLDVTLRGSYRDLLATVRQILGLPVALTMTVASITRSTDAPTLMAHIHVVLEHLPSSASLPSRHATGDLQNARPN